MSAPYGASAGATRGADSGSINRRVGATTTTLMQSFKVSGDAYNRYELYADGTIKTGDGTASPAVPVDPSQWAIDDAVETMFRGEVVSTSANLQTSGRMNFTHFRANRNLLAANWNTFTGGTAAGATPTLCRVGLYTVAANGDLTLVASTASDTTLFAAANTKYTKALSSSYQIVRGNTYAVGILVVSGAAIPNFCGASMGTGLVFNESPVMVTRLDGQTDLPSSLARSTVVSNNVFNPWRIWSWFT